MEHPLTTEGRRIIDYLCDHYPAIRDERLKLEESLLYKEEHESQQCWALVRNGIARCSRKRQQGQLFCGNHMRNRPYGHLEQSGKDQIATWVDPKYGDDYLIDTDGNVYTNNTNPQKIGKIVDDEIRLDREV